MRNHLFSKLGQHPRVFGEKIDGKGEERSRLIKVSDSKWAQLETMSHRITPGKNHQHKLITDSLAVCDA